MLCLASRQRGMVESAGNKDVAPSEQPSVQPEGLPSMLEQRRSGAVVCSSSGRPEAWAEGASCADLVKPGVERRSYAPIMVSCSGSDEGDSSSSDQQQTTPLLQPNTSVTSMLDGMDSANYRSIMSSQPTPARMISEAEVQAGCFKTGTRYCLETWPNSCILRVRVRNSSSMAVCLQG